VTDGVRADLCLTDPPYGIDIVGKNGKIGADNIAKNQVYKSIVSDQTTNTAKQSYLLALKHCGNFIIWGGNYFTDFLPPRACWIVWDKREGMNSNNFADCEIAWTSFDKPARIYHHLWNGMIRKGNDGAKRHPTQKPIQLHCDIIDDFCNANYLILDLFLGSGTTMIAAEMTHRSCYGLEIDPEYCSVILQRLSDMGLQPIRAG
jgi:DNA modification methylase